MQIGIVASIERAFPMLRCAWNKNEGKMHVGRGVKAKKMGRIAGREDLTVDGPGRFVAILEVKDGEGALTEEQRVRLRRMSDNGFPVAMVRCAASAVRIVGEAWAAHNAVS